MTQPIPPVDGGAGPPRRPSRGRLIGNGLAWTSQWSARLILTALGVVLLGLVIGELWSVVLPVLLGLIIATVLEPPATWLRRRRVPPLLAAIIVFLGALAVVGGIITVIAPQVAAQIPELVASATSGIEGVQGWLATTFGLGQTQIGQAVQAGVDQLQSSATAIAGTLVTGIGVIANGLIDLVLALVLAFLFVKDGYRFLPWLGSQVGTGAGAHFAAVGGRAWDRLGGFIRSQAIIGLADAAFIGVGLVILGVPLALPLAVLTFFGAFIPIVGALAAGALSVLIALVSNGVTNALVVLVLILVVQQIEGNLLQPLVQGKGLGLHAAVVILAVTGGSSLAGVVGAFLAVPVVAVAAEIGRYLNEQIDARARSHDEHPSQTPRPTDAELMAASRPRPAANGRLARWRRRSEAVAAEDATNPALGAATPDGAAATNE